MTEMKLREILCDAMVKEYEWVPAPEDLQYDYTFSPEFEEKTLRRHSMARAKYSKRLMRKLGLPLLVILGVLFSLVQRIEEIKRGEEDEAKKY